jgi:uncharacterized protein (UPF0262 family)
MLNPRDLDPKADRILAVTLDPNTITSIDPDEVHEWRIAIYDLVEQNLFRPARVKAKGPFALHVSIVGNWIVLDVRDPETYEPIAAHYLSLTPFRRLIRDYFRIRGSYYEAIKTSSPFQIEAVDMARRGMHNEAAELLRTRLDNKLEMDLNTARRLFTLNRSLRLLDELCALPHRGGARPQVLPRPAHRAIGRCALRQGRWLRPRGDGGDRRRHVGPYATHHGRAHG